MAQEATPFGRLGTKGVDVTISQYVLEDGVSTRLGTLLPKGDGRCFLITDHHSTEDYLAQVEEGLVGGGACAEVEVLRAGRGLCDKDEARAIARHVRETGVSLVVGLGNSKVLDLSRAILSPIKPDCLPYALVPTSVSSNACVGRLAVMYDRNHRVNGFWGLEQGPVLVAVDMEVVSRTPARLLALAIGDQVASSLEAIHASEARGIEPEGLDDHVRALDVLREQGREAFKVAGSGQVTPAFETVIRAITYYAPAQEAASGVNLAHSVGEVLSALPELARRSHGEVVGACVPAELVVSGNVDAVLGWANLLGDVGLPVGLAQLGLQDVSRPSVEELCEQAASGMMGLDSPCCRNVSSMVDALLEAEELVGRL